MSRQRLAWTALLGVLWATPALATEDEITVNAGLVTMNSESMQPFADNAVMPTLGVRAGWAFHDRLSLLGGLHTGQRGLQVVDQATSAEAFRTAYRASTLSAALKVDVEPSDFAAPYALAGVVGHLGVVRLDDDPTRRDHPGQLRSASASLGATGAVGIQFRMAKPDAKVRPALNLELGWQGVLPHRYPAGGDRMLPQGYSGVAFKSGVGIVF